MYLVFYSCVYWAAVLSTHVVPMPIIEYMLLLLSPLIQWTITQEYASLNGLRSLKKRKKPYIQFLPFAFPAGYVILSTYMMSASFVSFLLMISGLLSSMLTVSPWSDAFFSDKAPTAPPEPFDSDNDPVNSFQSEQRWHLYNNFYVSVS